MPAETTLDDLTWPLMMGHSVVQPYCCVCGRADRLNLHHVVRRGGGNLYYAGRPLEKPVLTLCGSGTEGCHGRAHQMELHFRWAGRWEYLDTGVPTKYQRALVMDGWRPIREGEL